MDSNGASKVELKQPPALSFPFDLAIDGRGGLKLFADGHYEGDGRAFLAELEALRGSSNEVSLVLWCVANVVRKSLEQ